MLRSTTVLPCPEACVLAQGGCNWNMAAGRKRHRGKRHFLAVFFGTYPLVSSNMAGWKIPELNGGFIWNITDKWSIFQQAMFEYRRVLVECKMMFAIGYI